MTQDEIIEMARERLIRIMGTFDLATGHADTFDELLDSLESELRDVLGYYRQQRTEQEPSQRKPLTEEFGIVGYADVGQHSIQVIFKDRRNADRFKTAHGIKENT